MKSSSLFYAFKPLLWQQIAKLSETVYLPFDSKKLEIEIYLFITKLHKVQYKLVGRDIDESSTSKRCSFQRSEGREF